MKSRFLCMIAFLLMAGTMSAQTHYTPNAHAYDNNMPIVAQVTLDGDIVTAGELGAFVGTATDDRGSALVRTDLNNTFWIQVYYDSENEASEPVSFKYYNGTDEYDIATSVAMNAEGAGTAGEPVVLAITTTVTQTTTMPEGWSWWSSPVELGDIQGLAMLENSLGTSGIRIQSKNSGYVDRFDYNGNSVWFGTLQSIVNEEMYKVNTGAVCSATMTGSPASASQHPITINNGFNWIGFPSAQDISVTSAMSGFTPEANDQIKSKNSGYTTYVVYGSAAMWYGTLNTLKAGEGYMYLSNSNTSKTLTFQTGRNEDIIANVDSKNNICVPQDEKYASNMTITAMVEYNGKELRSEEFEIAAYVGNECRGSVKMIYVEPLDRYLAFLLVAGDFEENLSFVLTDGIEMSQSSDHFMYMNDGVIGNPTEPVVLHFDALSVNENQVSVNVYPNPSDGIFTIESNNIRRIEVLNAFGQVIISKEVQENNVQINLSDKAVGTYLLRVISDNGIATKKLVKE